MKMFCRIRDGKLMLGKESGEREQKSGCKAAERGKIARGCDSKDNDREPRSVRWTRIDGGRVHRETMRRIRMERWSEG
jgi:hypothetical protein